MGLIFEMWGIEENSFVDNSIKMQFSKFDVNKVKYVGEDSDYRL